MGIDCIILQEMLLFQAKPANPIKLHHETIICEYSHFLQAKLDNQRINPIFFPKAFAINVCCWIFPSNFT